MVVLFSSKAKKSRYKLDKTDQLKVEDMVAGFYNIGPYRKDMSGFCKLYKSGNFKAHLSNSLVAIWKHDKEDNIVHILYVGKRESAPYDLLT